MSKTLPMIIAAALTLAACVSVDKPSVAESVQAQLATRGYSSDPARPAEVIGDSTALRYVHPDGRAALVMRNDTTHAEQGAIYDPLTLTALEELVPYAGDVALASCSSTWFEWLWSGYMIYQSHCFGDTGTLCMTWVGWISPSGDNPQTCQHVACACAGGGGGDPTEYPHW